MDLSCTPQNTHGEPSACDAGTALAYKDGYFSGIYLGLTLVGALLIQIGTNLCNDYCDFKKGADTPERIGPTRVTQAGLIAPNQVRAGFVLAFGLAACVGLCLVLRAGWPILLIGVASILSGIAYTAGPYALAYLGLGELFVLIFLDLWLWQGLIMYKL